jgi:hypothetical protein
MRRARWPRWTSRARYGACFFSLVSRESPRVISSRLHVSPNLVLARSCPARPQNTDISDLTGSQIDTLNSWVQKYEQKYTKVGVLVK